MIALLLLMTSWMGAICDGSNILVLSPITAPSHSNFFKPIVKELAKRNHSVTYWNGLKPDPGMHHNVRQLYSEKLDRINSDHQVGFNDRDNLGLLIKFYDRTVAYCKAIYQDGIFHQLMNTNEHFDLVLLEGVLNECTLPLIHGVKAPFIYLNSISPTPWLLDAIGSPQGYDHFPNPAFSFTDRMSFWQRTMNTAGGFILGSFRRWVMLPTVDRIASRMLGLMYGQNLTSVTNIEDQYLSLLIVNTHLSINYELPKSPALIEAGGLHCVPSKPLPSDLEDFVNSSGDSGFIVVSFGSILKGSNMSEDIRRLFVSTFSRLHQKVIWKWEDQSNGSLPANVKLMSWLPQQDLLGHPRARLFITHGGLFSNQEAVYHGVPLIAMPVFADQPINAQKIHNDGYGIRLDWDLLTEEALYDAIQTILNNQSYTERVKQISRVMRDQLEHPLDRAIYWIEYVMRHKGAPHLRTATRDLNMFQRGLVDVMILMLGFCLLLSIGIFALVRFLLLRRVITMGRHVLTKIKEFRSSTHEKKKKKE